MAEQQSQGPIKTFEVVKNSTLTYHELEVRQNGSPFLWTNFETHFFHDSIMTMHMQGPNGPVVAGARFPKMATGVDVTIGDARNAKDENFVPVESDSMTGSSYVFPGANTGHMYEWRRTHNKDYGSTHLSNSDFKLVDPSNNDMVLAVYVKDSFFGGPSVARIDFMVQLEDELELQAVTAILAVEEKLRKKRSNGSVGGVQGTASASAANMM